MPQRARTNLWAVVRALNLNRWERIGWIALLIYVVLDVVFVVFTYLLGIRLPEPWQTLSPYAEVVGDSLFTFMFLAVVMMFVLRCVPQRWRRSWPLWLALGVFSVWQIGGAYDLAARTLPGHALPALNELAPGPMSVLGVVDKLVWPLLIVLMLALLGWLRRRQGRHGAPPLPQSDG
jgi:hypothetical protein